MSTIKERYFDWIYGIVIGKRRGSYRRLLRLLHAMDFYYSVPMDGNRFEDGVSLRYRFGREHDIPDSETAFELDDCPCSVLEMMAALCIRCEECIMDDPSVGDRTAVWFFTMLGSLGLDKMTDSRFHARKAYAAVWCMLDRAYQSDGTGGLFTIPNTEHDMRTAEIWYQMMWYLGYLDEKENENEDKL